MGEILVSTLTKPLHYFANLPTDVTPWYPLSDASIYPFEGGDDSGRKLLHDCQTCESETTTLL